MSDDDERRLRLWRGEIGDAGDRCGDDLPPVDTDQNQPSTRQAIMGMHEHARMQARVRMHEHTPTLDMSDGQTARMPPCTREHTSTCPHNIHT